MGRFRIGIDIGSHVIKLAWTQPSRRGGVSWHYDQRPRDPSDRPEEAAVALTELLHPVLKRCFDVPVAVAVAQSHVRQVSLKATNSQQVSSVLERLIPTLFPFELSRCRYRSRVIRQDSVHGQLSLLLQVAACDLDVLRRDLEALWRIGWIPSEAYPPAVAMAALAAAQPQWRRQTVLLLDLGARHSTLAILAGGHVAFARDVALGSEDLTEVLTSQIVVDQETLQLSRRDAEELKRKIGIPRVIAPAQVIEGRLPLGTYQALLQPVLEQWLEEIRRTIAFGVRIPSSVQTPEVSSAPREGGTSEPVTYHVKTTPADVGEPLTPQALLLCGGGSRLPGLEPWLDEQLGMPVYRLSTKPFLADDLPELCIASGLLLIPGLAAQQKSKSASPLPAVIRKMISLSSSPIPEATMPVPVDATRVGDSAAQSATRGARSNPCDVSLLPQQTMQVRQMIRAERLIVKGLMITIVALWCGVGLRVTETIPVKQRLLPLQSRWKQLEPATNLITEVNTRTSLLVMLLATRKIPVDWLEKLAKDFPKPIRLTKLVVTQVGDVQLEGHAQARDQTPEAYVSELAMWLQRVGLCQSVRLGPSQRSPASSELVDFSVTCHL